MLIWNICLWLLAGQLTCAAAQPGRLALSSISPNTSVQDIITWDEHSMIIHGERVMIYAAEVHPFR